MKMTESEKLVGIETMKSRIYQHHKDRLIRQGWEWKWIGDWKSGTEIATWKWQRVVDEYRRIPEGQEWTPTNRTAEYYVPGREPTPKTESQMAAIIKSNGRASLMG